MAIKYDLDTLKDLSDNEFSELAERILTRHKEDDTSQAELNTTKGRRAEIGDTIKHIFRQAKRFDLLTGDEEKKLSRRIQKGDKTALDKLILSNLRLVINISKKYNRKWRTLSLEDLIQSGIIGLIRAAKKFKAEKNCRFSTYATYWIKQQIERGVAEKERTVRLPIHVITEMNTVKKCLKNLSITLNRDATAEEVAEALGMPKRKVANLLDVSRWSKCSLNGPIRNSPDEKDSKTLEQVLNLPTYISPEEEFGEKEARQKLMSELNTEIKDLSDNVKFVLKKRFMEDDAVSLEAIGKELGITRERVRQIQNGALAKLKKKLKNKKDFLFSSIA